MPTKEAIEWSGQAGRTNVSLYSSRPKKSWYLPPNIYTSESNGLEALLVFDEEQIWKSRRLWHLRKRERNPSKCVGPHPPRHQHTGQLGGVPALAFQVVGFFEPLNR